MSWCSTRASPQRLRLVRLDGDPRTGLRGRANRFSPCVDGGLRGLYADFAIEAERHLPGSRRRRHATTSAYWLAVRDDLLHPANQKADKATRQGLLSQRQRDRQKVDLLAQLTSLRLLDALAWALATKKLPTTSVAST
jgi:hypothetical protein